ncbi:uncharacterized protein YabE (DUF348 family) [Tumebacillus sp. BK434]|uniref:3D domain-containing protein n=1 Tax=Tumebacillus sp. BK434 TaxID=2512169 RepID=UPI0010534110|nr:3D domain-containing protein [Tumebacillus sp. BK434]TCP59679.1 uncharacterized protein YabE (DUF348 family) [Tumebacillus sp. BK434]
MQKVNRKSVYCLSAAAVALLIGGVATATSTYKTVTLEVDGQKQEISGFQVGTVGELLRDKGVTVGTEDLVQPAAIDALAEGTIITVTHAKSIQIQDGTNEVVSVKTQAGTTEELLKELGIKLNQADKTNLELRASIENGQKITITRRSEEVKVAEESIPFQTERQPDANLYTGTEKVLTSGVEGKAKITTKIVFENGKEVDRKDERTVVSAPVNQVVSYGTQQRPVVVASRGSDTNLTAMKVLTMAASAYSMPGERTASGGAAGQGTIAVDPNVIPLGTKLYIEGYGYGVASDVGGAIKGNRIDIHFDTREQALQFGRRAVKVHILN